MSYLVIFNRPGYLLDSEPVDCETREEAIESALDEAMSIYDVAPEIAKGFLKADLERNGVAYFEVEEGLTYAVEVRNKENWA